VNAWGHRTLLALWSLVTLCVVQPARAEAPTPSAFVSAVEAIEPDPDETLFETHYVTSNERHHTSSLAFAHETGGVFIGIGTDQNFLLIPHLRPSHLVMVDFDQWAIDAHAIYQHLFRTRATPAEFVNFFRDTRVHAKRRELRESAAKGEQGARMERVYARYRGEILKRLLAVSGRLIGRKLQGYLNDQATYDYLRSFVLEGRYAALRGDLTGARSLTSLARALRTLNLQVGTIALSNAEQYFDYTANFKQNMRAFEFAPNALVFRTFRVGGRHYEYYLQSMSAFLEWLKAPRPRNVSRLIQRRIPTPHPRVFTLPGRATCQRGLCPILEPCDGIPYEGCCEGTTLRWCLFDTAHALECSLDGAQSCGWSEREGRYTCRAGAQGPVPLPIACP
jgi:hypothetical protein